MKRPILTKDICAIERLRIVKKQLEGSSVIQPEPILQTLERPILTKEIYKIINQTRDNLKILNSIEEEFRSAHNNKKNSIKSLDEAIDKARKILEHHKLSDGPSSDFTNPPVHPTDTTVDSTQPSSSSSNSTANTDSSSPSSNNTGLGNTESEGSLSERVTTSSAKNETIFRDNTPKTIDLMLKTMSSEDQKNGNKGKRFVEEKVVSAFSKEDEEDDTRYDEDGNPDNSPMYKPDEAKKEDLTGRFAAASKPGNINVEDYDSNRIDPTSSMRYGDPEQTQQPINLFNLDEQCGYHKVLPSLTGDMPYGSLIA